MGVLKLEDWNCLTIDELGIIQINHSYTYPLDEEDARKVIEHLTKVFEL